MKIYFSFCSTKYWFTGMQTNVSYYNCKCRELQSFWYIFANNSQINEKLNEN